jgi:hypothetical protein
LPHFLFSLPNIFLLFSSILSSFLHLPFLFSTCLSSYLLYLHQTHHLLGSLPYQLHITPILPIPLQSLTKAPTPQQLNYTLIHIRTLLPYTPHSSHPFPTNPTHFLLPPLVPSF